MKSMGYTMTIDHVTITELPSAVDRKTRRSLKSRFERYVLEHRMLHLLVLPQDSRLDFASLGMLAELNDFVHKRGGEMGLVAWQPEVRRQLQSSGIDHYFRCFTSVEAGVAANAQAVAAVFPPWWSAAKVLAAAAEAGEVVDVGASPAVLIVRSQQPGLQGRLRAAGAILLLDPRGAGACGHKFQE